MSGPSPFPLAARSRDLAPGWTNVTSQPAPVPMAGAMMAFSPKADRFVLFGGWDGTQGLNQTWVFDPGNRTWTELHPPASPIGRGDEMFVYDSRGDLFVLFGGWHELANETYVRLSDTWTFSLANGTWTQRHPADSPTARSDAMVAYDSATDAVLLLGGFSGTAYLGDVWAYTPSNDTWVPRPALAAPSARADGRMVYVASQDRFLLFGGNDYTGPNLSFHHLADTWTYTWSTNTWSRLSTLSAPSARDYPVFAVDPNAGVALLTSGYGERVSLNDLWGFNLTTDTWANLTPAASPPGRFAATGGFDPVDDVLLLFSGASDTGLLGDTWLYRYAPPTPAAGDPGLVAILVIVAAAVIVVTVGVIVWRSETRRPQPPDEAPRNRNP